MAFSLFNRRKTEPEATEERNETVSERGASQEAEPAKLGFFDRMRQAVTRTRESFSDSIGEVLALTREIDETSLAELEIVLLQADIGGPTAKTVIENLRQRALRHGIEGGAELKRLLKLELKQVLDRVETKDVVASTPPTVVMMVGVNGTGKTTTTGKLAHLYRSQGKTVLLCAADTFRAAAIEQLEVWAARSEVPIIKTKTGGDPSAALFDACTAAKARGTDVLIVDTAGRLHTQSHLMRELEKVRAVLTRKIPGAPHEVLLVLDATNGQNAIRQAEVFTKSIGCTGIVLTKLDGTAKGGVVVAVRQALDLPVKFVGVGEAIDDLQPFDADAFVESIFT